MLPRLLAALRRAPTELTMRRIALAGVLVQCGIVVTGAAVRLTSSGLGCPRWPKCTGDSLVPVPDGQHHAVNQGIEFGNRLLTFAVLTVGIACVLAARRTGRRDLVRLAWLQPLGVVGQIVLGGITVLVDLHPAAVGAHFLLSMAIIAAAVALWWRTGTAEPAEVTRELGLLARGLVPLVLVLLVVGTVVTGTGPHAGDASSPRYGFSIERVAQLHADLVFVTIGATLALLLGLRLTAAPPPAQRVVAALAAVELAQGVLGYVQYFTGVPAVLVGLHVLGAVLTWVCTLRVAQSLRPAVAAA